MQSKWYAIMMIGVLAAGAVRMSYSERCRADIEIERLRHPTLTDVAPERS